MPEICWTAKAVADRIEEAAQTLRRLPPVRVRGYINTWPPTIRGFRDALRCNTVEVRLGPPAPDAIGRMDGTLAWRNVLDRDEVRRVWAPGRTSEAAVATAFGEVEFDAWEARR